MRVVETIVTSAQPAVVWEILADVERWHEWTPTIIAIKPLNSMRLKTGALYRVAQPKLRPAVYEVTECVPESRFTWVQKLMGGMMIADHRITPRDSGAEVELSFSSKGLLANIVGRLALNMISTYVETEARSLKNHCDLLALSSILWAQWIVGTPGPIVRNDFAFSGRCSGPMC